MKTNDPELVAPGLWAARLPGRGRRYFRARTLAALWLIDPDNPVFGPVSAPIPGSSDDGAEKSGLRVTAVRDDDLDPVGSDHYRLNQRLAGISE